MSSAVIVRKVESAADHKSFFEFPWSVYKDDSNWVPPLLSIRRDILNKKKNPAWEYMEGDYYLALRGEKVVGTIAAFVNHRHNEFHQENIAWFGFFECDNDAEAAAALFKTAMDWVKAHGYDALRGPQNFTTHDECGLLIDGFTRPIMLMPYNPPYYQKLVEDLGFHKVIDAHSYYYNWKMAEARHTESRVDKLTKRIVRNTNATVRQINRKNLKADFVLFKEIYNDAWEKNWDFTPMTDKELDALIESLSAFFDPRLACFVEVDEKVVGFMLGVPDFNQVLQLAHPRPGEPEPITLAKAVWHWKLRPKIDWMRIPLMGVREEYRNKGLDILMMSYFYHTMQNLPYQYMDCGWILESNHNMVGTLKGFGTEIHRTYRFYEKGVELT